MPSTNESGYAMDSHDPQLLKGVLSLLLLRQLERHEDYGYSIVLRLRHHGFDGLAEGTVYPALTRLEKRGLLSSRMVRSSSGPARKYYALTSAGAIELASATKAWGELVSRVDTALSDVEVHELPNVAEPKETCS